MLRQILFEMKITFKSIKTMIYMIFVFLYTLTILFGIAAKDTGLLTYQQEADYKVAYARWMGAGVPVLTDEELKMSYYGSYLLEIQELINSENIKEYMRIKVESDIDNYEMWEMAYLQLSEKGHGDWFKDAFDDRQVIIDLRKEFGREIEIYELPFNYLNQLTDFWYSSASAKMNLKYDYELYKSNEILGTGNRVDAMTSLMHYQSEVLPNITWIIVILLLMDSMFRDFDNGTIKMLITLPKDRSRYILVKLISTFLSSILVLTLPILIIFAGLFIKHGFSSMNYPVLANLGGFTSTDLEFQYMPVAKQIGVSNYKPVSYGIAKTIKGVYTFTYTNGGIKYILEPSLASDVIPLWQLIVVSVLPFLTGLLFYCCFGIMMSVLIRNRNGFVLVSGIMIGISLFVASAFFGQSWTMYNPMSLNSGIALVLGILPNTAFSAMTVLPMYSLICITVAIIYFKKLDIH